MSYSKTISPGESVSVSGTADEGAGRIIDTGWGYVKAVGDKSTRRALVFTSATGFAPRQISVSFVAHNIKIDGTVDDDDSLRATFSGKYDYDFEVLGGASGSLFLGLFAQRSNEKFATDNFLADEKMVSKSKNLYEYKQELTKTFSNDDDSRQLNIPGTAFSDGDIISLGVWAKSKATCAGSIGTVEVDAMDTENADSFHGGLDDDDYIEYDQIDIEWVD